MYVIIVSCISFGINKVSIFLLVMFMYLLTYLQSPDSSSLVQYKTDVNMFVTVPNFFIWTFKFLIIVPVGIIYLE